MTINIHEDLSAATFEQFSVNIGHCYKQVETLKIDLFCEGGNPDAALAYAAKMRLVKNRITIIVQAYGLVASSAVLLLASGTVGYRRMAKESWVMLHEASDQLKGNVTELEIEANMRRRAEEQWCDLLEGMTDTKAEKWAKLHKQTTYLSADECLELGLIDEII